MSTTNTKTKKGQNGSIIRSRKIEIFPVLKANLPAEFTQIERKQKIGSSYLKTPALAFDEAALLLPELIKTTPTSEKWEKSVAEYWANIGVLVPETGKELEIGFKYDNESDAKNGEDLNIYESTLDSSTHKLNYGYPINIADYVLFRYCIVYGHVASSREDIYKSPKIRFYIDDKEAEINSINARLAIRTEAYAEFLRIATDLEKLDNIGAMIGVSEPRLLQSTIENFIITEPQRFLNLVRDEKLGMKAFINKCLQNSVLTILPNSTIIQFNEDRVGQNMEDAVSTLLDPKNQTLKDRIEANLKAKPLKTQIGVLTPLAQKTTENLDRILKSQSDVITNETKNVLDTAVTKAGEIMSNAEQVAANMIVEAQKRADALVAQAVKNGSAGTKTPLADPNKKN